MTYLIVCPLFGRNGIGVGMRDRLNKLLGALAIFFAATLLGVLTAQATNCHSTDHMAISAQISAQDRSQTVEMSAEHSISTARISAARETTTGDATASKSSQPRHSQIDLPHHRLIGAVASLERQSQRQLCSSGMGICCFICPERTATVVMPSRPRETLAPVIQWPNSFIQATTPSLLVLSADARSSSKSWPPPVQITSWRSVLLEDSARLRI